MKLSVCAIAYNDEETVDMFLESALGIGDEIIIVDGGSTDLTVSIIKQFQENHPDKIKLIDGPKVKPEAYEKQLKDKYGRVMQNGHFGMMKKIALDNATGDWLFWLDLDEALQEGIRPFLDLVVKNNASIDCFDVNYIHFVHDFSYIDNSEGIHVGLMRFHKIIPGITFSKYNHALAEANFQKRASLGNSILIYHLGYARNLLDVWKRYKRNMIFSEMHFGINQCHWRDWHYFNYPKKLSEIHPQQLPQAIKNRFEIGIYDIYRKEQEHDTKGGKNIKIKYGDK